MKRDERTGQIYIARRSGVAGGRAGFGNPREAEQTCQTGLGVAQLSCSFLGHGPPRFGHPEAGSQQWDGLRLTGPHEASGRPVLVNACRRYEIGPWRIKIIGRPLVEEAALWSRARGASGGCGREVCGTVAVATSGLSA